MTREYLSKPYIDAEVAARARAAVAALRTGPAANLSALVEHALRKEVERLERQHNGGEPFPAVGKLPPGGRRPG